jgi:hypothetical protein
MRVGFEPTPFRTTDNRCFKDYETLTWRLRPLGHLTIVADILSCANRVCRLDGVRMGRMRVTDSGMRKEPHAQCLSPYL